MDEQDKKPLDAENMSDEELDEVAGGIVQSQRERKQLRKFLEGGGTIEEWHQKLKNRPFSF